MTDYEKKIEPIDIIQLECGELVSQEETKSLISKVPINVLFNPEGIQKRDVWDIDLIQILSMLLKILEKTDKKDLRVAGMAALSSSLIYKLKVESRDVYSLTYSIGMANIHNMRAPLYTKRRGLS